MIGSRNFFILKVRGAIFQGRDIFCPEGPVLSVDLEEKCPFFQLNARFLTCTNHQSMIGPIIHTATGCAEYDAAPAAATKMIRK